MVVRGLSYCLFFVGTRPRGPYGPEGSPTRDLVPRPNNPRVDGRSAETTEDYTDGQ